MELIIVIALVVVGVAVYYNRKKLTTAKPVEPAKVEAPALVVAEPVKVETSAPAKKAPAKKVAAKPASKPASKTATKRPAAKKAPASK